LRQVHLMGGCSSELDPWAICFASDRRLEAKSAPPGIQITRIVLWLKSGIHWSAKPWLHPSIRWQTIWGVFVCSRRSSENCDRRSDVDRTEECNRQLLRHPHAPMRCRITGEISRVHSVSFMEPHEVTHGRGNKFATSRYFHVDISVGHNGLAIRVHDLAVDAGVMIYLFFEDLERPGLRKMPVPPARDWRFQNQTASPNQKGGLLLKIDLHPKRISILCAH
jgi:hypothetical protein